MNIINAHCTSNIMNKFTHFYSHHQNTGGNHCISTELGIEGQNRSAISTIGDVAHRNSNMLGTHSDIGRAIYT